jgi:hypothetical protein
VSLGSLVTFIIVLLKSGTGYHFIHFPLNPVLNYFFEESDFHSFFFFPLLHLVLCDYDFDKLVGGFDYLISLPDVIFVL